MQDSQPFRSFANDRAVAPRKAAVGMGSRAGVVNAVLEVVEPGANIQPLAISPTTLSTLYAGTDAGAFDRELLAPATPYTAPSFCAATTFGVGSTRCSWLAEGNPYGPKPIDIEHVPFFE